MVRSRREGCQGRQREQTADERVTEAQANLLRRLLLQEQVCCKKKMSRLDKSVKHQRQTANLFEDVAVDA